MRGKALVGFMLMVALGTVAISHRHKILLPLITTGAQIPQLVDANPVPGGRPFGDENHFSIVQLDAKTYAIAEPYSWARNVNYLVLGDRRALLFDAGVGHYDIRLVVESLTDLPVTFMPSHFHYDHTGQGNWAKIAIVDLPHLRERAEGNFLQPTWGEHLGDGEGIDLPTWNVTEWVKPNSRIDLGNRELLLVYTPGHTNNSVSLLDVQRQVMFSGDFISDGGLLNSMFPTARLGDYLQSADKVLDRTNAMQEIIFRGAHASPANTIPNSSRDDLQTLRDQLVEIRAGRLKGQGTYPVVYKIAEGMLLNTEPPFLQNWDPTYSYDHEVN